MAQTVRQHWSTIASAPGLVVDLGALGFVSGYLMALGFGDSRV